VTCVSLTREERANLIGSAKRAKPARVTQKRLDLLVCSIWIGEPRNGSRHHTSPHTPDALARTYDPITFQLGVRPVRSQSSVNSLVSMPGPVKRKPTGGDQEVFAVRRLPHAGDACRRRHGHLVIKPGPVKRKLTGGDQEALGRTSPAHVTRTHSFAISCRPDDRV